MRLPYSFGLPIAALASAALLLVPASLRAEETASPSPSPEVAAPASKATLRPQPGDDVRQWRDLVQAARLYLNLEEDEFLGYTAFRNQLLALAGQKKYILSDFPMLKWVVMQARSFLPPLDDTKWLRVNHFELEDRGPMGFEVRGPNNLWMHFRTPGSYPARQRDLDKYPRPRPWPVLYLLHEEREAAGADGAGPAALERAYPFQRFPALKESWLVVVPVAAKAAYVEDGRLRRQQAVEPMRIFWKHYHLDFDRVVLDGGQPALTYLSVMPGFFAGAVLRGGSLNTPKLKASVLNYVAVPLYVLGQPELAAALKEAGHPSVTSGDGSDLMAWLGERRRQPPTSFEWTIADVDQRQAWWINSEEVDGDATLRQLKVDTSVGEDGSNLIRIAARGILSLSVFLDDGMMDLDQKVRIEINGQVAFDDHVYVHESQKVLGRDLDEIFAKKPTEVRQWRYYGWLKSGNIIGLRVPSAAPDKASVESGAKEAPAAAPTASSAGPKEEADAKRLFEKAMSVRETDPERAKDLLGRVVSMPANAHTERARQALAELGGS